VKLKESSTRSCARAPVRVDPAGGGSDAPPFVDDHGGWVVNFGIQRHAFASAERLPKGSGVVIYTLDLDEGVVANSVSELSTDSHLEFLKGFVRRLVPEGDSLLLLTTSDVPAGSGMGGSGALGVAVVRAIEALYGREKDAVATAALANDVERNDLQYPGGSQDSYGAALGGMNLLEHLGQGKTVPRRLQVPDATRLAIESSSLLIYSGAAHVSGSIHDDIRTSYAEDGSSTLDAMFRLRDAAQTMAQALEAGDLEGYLTQLNTSCDQLYRLHPSCDSEDHRRHCDALDGLILARKTCGAGGGGVLLVHARPEERGECIRRAESLGGVVWPLTIDNSGVIHWSEQPTAPDAVERIRQKILAG
jgi:D-glycero-alpha-D-manno-heptose-7-phosphate kinase